MNGVQGLMDALRKSVKDTRERQEGKAQRCVIQGGRVCIGSRSYSFKAVVDCSTEEGALVWVQISTGGTAIILGA